MSGRDGEARPGPARPTESATFELERFAWRAPDRLELSGRFVGLPSPPTDAPVLVVRGAERTHRLAPAPTSAPGAPEDGRLWRAEFVWREAPEVFDVAQLQLGDEVAVDLPAPGEAAPRAVEVHHTGTEDGEGSAPPSQVVAPAAGADRLRLEAALLAAQEEAGELRAAAERAEQDLARARADLAAEREGRAADAERFREGLARVQGSAEGALNEANDAILAREAALEALRAELEAADLETARSAAREALGDAERLLARMTTIRDALGDP